MLLVNGNNEWLLIQGYRFYSGCLERIGNNDCVQFALFQHLAEPGREIFLDRQLHFRRLLHQGRDEIREKGKAHKELMTKTRYIWLKNPWNLTDKQQTRLSELEHLNLKINRAYLLKEVFREFWEYTRPGWAKRYLDKWFWWATHSRLEPLREFAWMLRRHQEDLMNYFRMPIHNGTVEGLNNKAKVISHKAYGFRTAKNYIRNLYHCMAGLSLPKTVHTFV